MDIKKLLLESHDFPEPLKNIPSPPKKLYVRGGDIAELLNTIVGTRKVSAYGKEVTTKLAGQVARTGVGILSGLVLGVDGHSHTVPRLRQVCPRLLLCHAVWAEYIPPAIIP